MPRFMMTYLGGDEPASPEEGRQHFARYRQWLTDLGDAAVSPMNPIRNTHTAAPDGTVTPASRTGMSGYTIVEADTIDAALAMATSCPFLAIGGSLEVSELIDMPA